MEAILILLATIWFLIGNIWVDGKHMGDGDFINHYSRAYLRSIFFIVIAIYNVRLAVASLLLFTALFDHILNVVIHQPLFYLGSTSKWVKFWKKRRVMYKIFKLIIFLTSGYLFFYGSL